MRRLVASACVLALASACLASSPPATPRSAGFVVSGVRRLDAGGFSKLAETVRYHADRTVGFRLTCRLIAPDGRRSAPGVALVRSLRAGHSRRGFVGIRFAPRVARAACTVALRRAVKSPPRKPVPARLSPLGIAFSDARHGVMIAGWTTRCASCLDRIETTSDGGVHWRVRDRLRAALSAVTIAPGGAVWVTIRGPGLLRSTDRGRSWHASGVGVRQPSFVSAAEGWALGSGSRAERTSDAGRHWRVVGDACRRLGSTAAAVSAVTPATAYVMCTSEPGAGEEPKALVRTSDGGRSWTVIDAIAFPGRPGAAPAPSHGLPIGGYVDGMQIRPSGRGWLWLDRGRLLRTNDAERWWIAGTVIRPDVTRFVAADFVTDGLGFALLWDTGGIELIRTRNGGRRWSAVARWPQ